MKAFSIPLLLGVATALVWANIAPENYSELFGRGTTLHFISNDVFMVFFFGLAAADITRSALPGGSLYPPSRAINPLFATLGGILGPVAVFFLYIYCTGATGFEQGWAIPTATDIAIAWAIARLAFGNTHPAVSFLLLLAIVDDAIGLVIIAVFYPDGNIQPYYLLLLIVAIAIAWLLRRNNVSNYWFYLILPGSISWIGLYLSHLHPALALVPIVPFMPTKLKPRKTTEATESSNINVLHLFEENLRVPIEFGLFIFALVNAGAPISNIGHPTWAILIALCLGKPLGVFIIGFFADKVGFRIPEGMSYKNLLLTGFISGIGLTVALFISDVAFRGETSNVVGNSAKMGALLSLLIAPIVLIVVKLRKKSP